MKFSENWLRELIDIPVSSETLVRDLSMLGLEVESVEKTSKNFNNVIVSKIISTKKHPEANNLKICQVFDGKKDVQIVCGASNARANILVPLAQIGAQIDKDIQIKEVNLRGIDSFGMLCSAKELGIGDDNDGILELHLNAPVGQDIKEYLRLDDNIIEINITPNRGDCLSIKGLAKELSALYKINIIQQQNKPIVENAQQNFTIINYVPELVPFYACRIIKNIDNTRETPIWLKEKLRRSDIKSINLVVDITNFTMLLLGTPLHSFNLDKINEKINIRYAKENETLTLLNKQEVKLSNQTLVIADNEKPLAIAGVIGGIESSTEKNTTDILLECAYFTPNSVAGIARYYGLNTDSSYRYERGVNFTEIENAINFASSLIQEISGGIIFNLNIIQEMQYLPKQKAIILSKNKIHQILGIDLKKEGAQILENLGCTVQEFDDSWKVTPPISRFDLTIYQDLIEEIARIYGYNNIPNTPLKSEIKLSLYKEKDQFKNKLATLGYQEVISYSFIDKESSNIFHNDFIQLLNPISQDLAFMRNSIIPSLMKIASYNLNHNVDDLKIFEQSIVFEGGINDLKQNSKICALNIGKKYHQNWTNNKNNVDFYDIKSDLLSILPKEDFLFQKMENSNLFHPGRNANISNKKNEIIGIIGQIHPKITKQFNIEEEIFIFEIDSKAIYESQVNYKTLSKFPDIKRDLSLIVPQNIEAKEVIDFIKKLTIEDLTAINIFDIYSGKGIDGNNKSIAINLTFNNINKTLNDSLIKRYIDRILSKLKIKNIYLRE